MSHCGNRHDRTEYISPGTSYFESSGAESGTYGTERWCDGANQVSRETAFPLTDAQGAGDIVGEESSGNENSSDGIGESASVTDITDCLEFIGEVRQAFWSNPRNSEAVWSGSCTAPRFDFGPGRPTQTPQRRGAYAFGDSSTLCTESERESSITFPRVPYRRRGFPESLAQLRACLSQIPPRLPPRKSEHLIDNTFCTDHT